MQIDIRPSNLALQPEHRERIARRVGFALSRLSGRVRRIEVCLADVNGPRGGIDKRCRVLVHMSGGGSMLVEEKSSDLLTLIDRALDRAGRAAFKRAGIVAQHRHSAQLYRRLAVE